MIALSIIQDGDNAWPDLKEKPYVEAEWTAVTVLRAGTESGKPSVTLRLELPDGTTALAQTSLALFLTAGDAFKARHGDPRQS
jgi:hypothetical protein